MKQEIMDLNQNEINWINKNLEITKGFILSQIITGVNDWLQPVNLDTVYKIWFSSHDKKHKTPTP